MTPRERWLAVLSGERPDRVPTDYWATGEVTERLFRELGCPDARLLWAKLEVDKSIHTGAALRDPRPGRANTSVWGVQKTSIAYGGGIGVYQESVSHPLGEARTVEEIRSYPWPNPAWWDVSDVRKACEDWPDYPRIGGSYEPFLLYCSLRGMEQAFEDLVSNPELAETALQIIYDIHEDIVRRTLDAAGDLIDFIYVAEDLGSQDSLLMSPAAFRRFIKPRMAKMIELVHSYGVKVFHHDDGAIRPLLPELLDLGVDVLNPIQWRCKGMARDGLARDFGERAVFHGAVDNQETLPFGTEEDVRQEVLENIELFSPGRGYICAPCHNIQPNTPTANILALYRTVREYGTPPRRRATTTRLAKGGSL
ncbi:MAG: uroporphyrinogen-III decarboxylase-like protein [Planctomycetes bacterium]|nr:uroporphyrinogen-III decarboxylase-like protein [Planctomycetota bacterium]